MPDNRRSAGDVPSRLTMGAILASISFHAGCDAPQTTHVAESTLGWSSSMFEADQERPESAKDVVLALDSTHPAYARNDERMGRSEPVGPVSREWTWLWIEDVQRSSHGRTHDTMSVRSRTLRSRPGQ